MSLGRFREPRYSSKVGITGSPVPFVQEALVVVVPFSGRLIKTEGDDLRKVMFLDGFVDEMVGDLSAPLIFRA